jgi:hypothetical protein
MRQGQLGALPEARRPRLRLDDVRRGYFRGDHIAFLDIFVAIFFIQNHDVRKRPDNQPLWLSAAGSGTRAALRASRFVCRRCRAAFSACFRRSVCRDIRAPVSGIVSREESYAQGGKAPTWRALLNVSLGTDPILIVIAVVIVIAATTAAA